MPLRLEADPSDAGGGRGNDMRRRDVLGLSAGAMLAMPHIARAQRERTLKFVPTPDLTVLDTVWSGTRATHNHAYPLGYAAVSD